MATWVPLTNRNGRPLSGITDPFRNGVSGDPLNPTGIRDGEPRFPDRTIDDIFGGRLAAYDAGGTPYGRPEDMEVGKLKNRREVIYFAATSENTVYTVEILSSRRARVNVLVDGNTPKNEGFTDTTGTLSSPDNLAQDAIGNIYVIEDKPNSDSTGGDIWFVRDINNDGYGESLDHFMSIRVDGSEATGMIFNPQVPTEFVVAVQHPDSTDLSNVPEGLGDAVWRFDISAVDDRRFVRRLENAKREKKKSGFYWWSKFLYWGDRW